MKKQKTKLMIKYLCLFFVGFSIISCKDRLKEEDPKTIAEDHNDAKFNDSKEKDAKFLVDAASINMEEVELSHLAITKAIGTKVKDLAKMMLDDHTKSLAEVKTLAAKKMVTLPASLSDDGKDAYNSLMEKTGSDFDKKYSEMMVDGHKAAIKEFETESNESTDMDIRDWATKTLSVLRGHLDRAMTCVESYK